VRRALPYVTLGGSSLRPGMTAIWLAMQMPKDWSTYVEGL
jgi:hypothetical protein